MEKETIHNEQSLKKRNIKLYFLIGIVILVIGATALSMNLLIKNESEQLVDSQESGELEQVAKTQDSADSQQSAEPESIRKFDEKTVEIAKYEMFYRDNDSFYNKETVEYYSLYETIEKYAFFHYLEQHGYSWDDERRAKAREWIQNELNYDRVNNLELFAYYEEMFETLQITEEDYIDYYLLVNKEYDKLISDLANNRIGSEIEGYYFPDEEAKAFSKLIGLSDELAQLAEKLPEPLTPMEPQPDLPFLTEDSYIKITTNAEGDYILVDTLHLPIRLGDAHRDLFFELRWTVLNNEDLNRHSLNRYQEAFATYKSDDPKKVETAKEIAQLLEILERSIEMELY
ncbi:MAG TPA: hypothetical protein VNR38_11265 [Ureibacillus sp.]|nr:hypothetical protein [Ureibacillus sp.]